MPVYNDQSTLPIDNCVISQGPVDTLASYVLAGAISPNAIAQRLVKEGNSDIVKFDEAVLHLVDLNYYLHDSKYFLTSRRGALRLRETLELLITDWEKHVGELPAPSQSHGSPIETYFSIREVVNLLGTRFFLYYKTAGSHYAILGLVRGLCRIYPSQWLIMVHFEKRPYPVHFDRVDYSQCKPTDAAFIW